jgi:hypothetical protein
VWIREGRYDDDRAPLVSAGATSYAGFFSHGQSAVLYIQDVCPNKSALTKHKPSEHTGSTRRWDLGQMAGRGEKRRGHEWPLQRARDAANRAGRRPPLVTWPRCTDTSTSWAPRAREYSPRASASHYGIYYYTSVPVCMHACMHPRSTPLLLVSPRWHPLAC